MHIYVCIYNPMKHYTPLYLSFEYIMHTYVLSKTKVKLGGLKVPFKKKLFGKKKIIASDL